MFGKAMHLVILACGLLVSLIDYFMWRLPKYEYAPTMELFSSRIWRLYWPKQKAVVFTLKQKIMQHMHGIIP